MIPYYIPVFFLLVSAVVGWFFKVTKGQRIVLCDIPVYLGLACLFVLSAFKGNVDPDYESYQAIFNQIPNISLFGSYDWKVFEQNVDNIEIGFSMFGSMVKYFGGDYRNFLIIFSAFFCCLTFFLFLGFGGRIKYACVLFFVLIYYTAYFIQIRFLVAVLFAVFAVFGFSRDRLFLSLVFIFIGSFFHSVALLVVVPILFCLFFSRWLNSPLLLLSLSVPLVSLSVFPVFSYLGTDVFVRYSVYVSEYDGAYGGVSSYYFRLMFVALFLWFFKFRDKEISYVVNRLEGVLLTCLLMGIYIWAVGNSIPILYRAAWFLDFGFLYFLFSYDRSVFKYKRILMFSCCLVLFVYRLVDGLGDFSEYYLSFE